MKSVFIALMAVIALSGCSSSSSDSGSGGGGPQKPAQPATCEEAWSMMVAGSPAGQVAEYQITTVNGGGAPTKTKEKITVLESDDEHIVTETEVNGQKNNSEVTQDAMLEACEQGGGPQQIPEGLQILEERGESITVKAGTFDTLYTKYSMTQSSDNFKMDSITEVWSMVTLTVKSVSVTTTTFEGQAPVKSTSTRELMKLKKGNK